MSLNKNLFPFILVLVFSQFTLLSAQNNTNSGYGILQGVIKAEDSSFLEGSNIVILETGYGVTSNKKGKYKFAKIPVGEYTLKVSYLGFERVEKKIKIYKNEVTNVNLILRSTSFNIGSIVVSAKNEFIPVDPVSKTVINSGEIEHLQASSLSDLMSLMPGGSKKNSNLNNAQSATIRGGESIGTQIVLDEVPLSNNVNLQTGIGYSTSNSGIDLRTLPASNIESIEIVSGVPSVKYGDLTDGVLIVKTKTKPVKSNLKVKYNPNITEFNGTYGLNYNDWVINTNLNIASSGRDVRIDDDGYTRFSVQTNISRDFENSRLKNSFYFTRSFDEKKEQPGYALRESWYNRDLIFRINSNYKLDLDNSLKLEATISGSYTKRDSYKQSLISRDNIVISDRTEPGTQNGHIVFGSYLGKKWIKGSEYNFYSDFSLTKTFYTGELFNKFLFGISYRNEFNKGDGIIFDPLYPPFLSTVSPRLRTYSDLPGLSQLSVYMEEKLVGKILLPVTLVAGVRMESYNPEFFSEDKFLHSQNGLFFNPRLNLSVKLDKTTQIRASYGITTKAPPLGMIAAQSKYFDVVDTVAINDPEDPAKNLSVVSTYIREQANPSMKAYKQMKYEVSIDKEFSFGGITLSAFKNETQNGFGSLSIPIALPKYSYPNLPDFANKIQKDEILMSYTRYENNIDTDIKGIELKFSSKRIPYINTKIKIDGSYSYKEKTKQNNYELGGQKNDTGLGGKVIPFYNSADLFYKNLKLNYRFDIQAKSIGMWFTLHLEHNVIQTNGYVDGKEKYAIGYFDRTGKYFEIKENERGDAKYSRLTRSVTEYELRDEELPQLFNVNLVVSKSLWKGAAISFFVNNFFAHQPYHRLDKSSDENPSYTKRNKSIFYGMEFLTEL